MKTFILSAEYFFIFLTHLVVIILIVETLMKVLVKERKQMIMIYFKVLLTL